MSPISSSGPVEEQQEAVTAVPSVPVPDLERDVAQVILDCDPLIRPAEVIRVVRRHIAAQVEAEHRAAPFGIALMEAAHIARWGERPSLPQRQGRGG